MAPHKKRKAAIPTRKAAKGTAMSGATTETLDDTAEVPPEASYEAASAYEEALSAISDEVAAADPAPLGTEDNPVPGPLLSAEADPVPGPLLSTEADSVPNVAMPGPQPSAEDTQTAQLPMDGLRLRMKVWTDPKTYKRYLMPIGLFRDVVRGQPVTDVMYAYAMRDDDTKLVTLTAAEWNGLPFFYFREDGWSPRTQGKQ